MIEDNASMGKPLVTLNDYLSNLSYHAIFPRVEVLQDKIIVIEVFVKLLNFSIILFVIFSFLEKKFRTMKTIF